MNGIAKRKDQVLSAYGETVIVGDRVRASSSTGRRSLRSIHEVTYRRLSIEQMLPNDPGFKIKIPVMYSNPLEKLLILSILTVYGA